MNGSRGRRGGGSDGGVFSDSSDSESDDELMKTGAMGDRLDDADDLLSDDSNLSDDSDDSF